jgi:hypothetical protein
MMTQQSMAPTPASLTLPGPSPWPSKKMDEAASAPALSMLALFECHRRAVLYIQASLCALTLLAYSSSTSEKHS